MVTRKQLLVLISISLLFSFGYCRPQFASTIPEFEGSSTADDDGVFRHDSNQILKKRNVMPTNNYLRYEAILIDGIVRLDDVMFIEQLLCQQSELGTTISVLKTSASHDLEWTNETVLVGGAEWNCIQNSQEYPTPFTARVLTRLPQKTETYLVEFIPMSDLFKHLDLELRLEELHATTVNPDLTTQLASKRNSIPFSSLSSDFSNSAKTKRSKRTTDPAFVRPIANDMFFEGDDLTIEWINIPGETATVECYNSNGLVYSIANISLTDNTGVYTTIDETWPSTSGYYVRLLYNCDDVSCSSQITSDYFAVNWWPDIYFNSPARGSLYIPGDIISISVKIDNPALTGPFWLRIYQQIDYAFDVQYFSISFTDLVFEVNVTVDESWASSNSYYALVEYNCGLWCDSQSSELFSVISTDSTNTLQFDEPYQGSVFQQDDFIHISIVGDFLNDTIIALQLMQRRLGWDYERGDPIYLIYSAGQDQLRIAMLVDPSWEESRRYYVTAYWGCDNVTCTGYAESAEFAVNYYPVLSLDSLKTEYSETDTVVLSWNSTQQFTDMSIQVCSSIPGPDPCVSLGTHDTNELSLEWPASQGSVIWDNYFYIQYDCTYGIFCEAVESKFFRIREEFDVLDWNWDPIARIPEISDYVFYHEDCNSIRSTGEYCDFPQNANTSACQLCNMPGFQTSFDLTCHDCYAQIGVTVNDLKITISWFTLQQFITNLTINATSELDMMAQFNMDFQTGTEVPLLQSPIQIYGLPPITIAGFTMYFEIYGTVKLSTQFNIDGNVNAHVNATVGAAYDVSYDSDSDIFLTESTGSYFAVREFDMSMQDSASLRVSIVPQIELALMNQENVLYINAEPYVNLSLSGSLPPYNALPNGTVPQNNATAHLFTNNCEVQHWLEFGVSSGVTWNGGSNWDISDPYVVSGTLIDEFPIASGCLWPAENSQGSSAISIRFAPYAFSMYGLTTEAFQIAIVFDVAASLNIPIGAVARVNLTLISDQNGFMVFEVFFSDTDTLVAEQLSSSLALMTVDCFSPFFSQTRYVTKSADSCGTPSPSVTPTPSGSASAFPSPSATPTTSATPVSSASATPSITPSSSQLILPSSSPTPSVTPSVSQTPSVTPSFTPSNSVSSSPGASTTPTQSVTPSMSVSSSSSPSPSSSPTISPTPSVSPSMSPTPTSSPTTSPSLTPSATPSISASNTPIALASSSSSPQTNSPGSKSNATTYIVIGSVVAVVVGAALIGGIVFFVKKRRSPKSFGIMLDEL